MCARVNLKNAIVYREFAEFADFELLVISYITLICEPNTCSVHVGDLSFIFILVYDLIDKVVCTIHTTPSKRSTLPQYNSFGAEQYQFYFVLSSVMYVLL